MAEDDGVNWDVMLPVVAACSGTAACCSVGMVVYCWFKVRHEISGHQAPARRRSMMPDFRAAFGGTSRAARQPPRGETIAFSDVEHAPDLTAAEEGLEMPALPQTTAAERAAAQFAAAQTRGIVSLDHGDDDDDAQSVASRTPSTAGSQAGGRGGSRSGGRRARTPSLSERVQTQADGSQDVFV
eukprot:Tamp_18095.p1 GENE.Tamp_18095~~Tamp_18095.p1  ORF type:complete len:199 (+),score=35.20 Tamp_18095:46-597(+)